MAWNGTQMRFVHLSSGQGNPQNAMRGHEDRLAGIAFGLHERGTVAPHGVGSRRAIAGRALKVPVAAPTANPRFTA